MKKVIYSAALILFLLPALAFAANVNPVQTNSVSAGEEIRTKIQEMNSVRAELREAVKSQVLQKAKAAATRAVVRAEARYEKINKRVEQMTNISTVEKEKISSEINAALTALGNVKIEIQSAVTAEEVKNVMTKLRTTLRSSKEAVHLVVDGIHATRLEAVTVKLAEILEKLNNKIADLKTAEKDVAGLEVLAGDAKSQIEEAKSKIGAKDFSGAKESIMAARKNMIELSQDIKAIQ